MKSVNCQYLLQTMRTLLANKGIVYKACEDTCRCNLKTTSISETGSEKRSLSSFFMLFSSVFYM